MVIFVIVAGLSLSYTNAWAETANDPTQGVEITAGSSSGPPKPIDPPELSGVLAVTLKDNGAGHAAGWDPGAGEETVVDFSSR
jgi:hypothetical protein